MKLKFRHQKFQAEAAEAVCDVFRGQPYLTKTYRMDRGKRSFPGQEVIKEVEEEEFTGYKNQEIVPFLTDQMILENIRRIQRKNQLGLSSSLEGKYNLTIEMETGVGKTYTYIKTIFELNKRYGWSKFIVVVPSVAIREGVYKSFQITEEHFAEEYGKKIRYFIYNSKHLSQIDSYARDSGINVMIINIQALGAKGKDNKRITMKLDEFRSRRPIDIISRTNPILIIDEPQSVEGEKYKKYLEQFMPMMTLRYSATHRKDSIYNMIYRLDALEAYNKKLVKKIEVKGMEVTGNTGTEGYIYLERLNLFRDRAPIAAAEIDKKGREGVYKKRVQLKEGDNLFLISGKLEAYKKGYIVRKIDGRDNFVEFENGLKLFSGNMVGSVTEEQLKRIQIRETILSHLERERQLFYKGIKVLSLFFIDEVAKYRIYDEEGRAGNGEYADIFEEEYRSLVKQKIKEYGNNDYTAYLRKYREDEIH
jgi:type III restriction enzyme